MSRSKKDGRIKFPAILLYDETKTQSVVVVNRQFITDVEIIMEIVIVLIDDSHTPIDRRHLQYVYQMPLGLTVIVGRPVKDDMVGSVVEMVIPPTDALIAWLQQVFMLVDHA